MKQFLTLLFLFITTCKVNSQEFVAKLIEGVDCANLIVNDSILGKVYKHERFITYKHDFEETYWPIWTKSGNFGSLDKKYFDLLPNEKVFKMFTDTSRLCRQACSSHSMDNFNGFGINYCCLVKEAVRGDENSLLKLFVINNDLYAAAAEIHAEIMWLIINVYSDDKFNNFLVKQSRPIQISIAELLIEPFVTYPISDIKYYYSEYYPSTWKTIISLIDIK